MWTQSSETSLVSKGFYWLFNLLAGYGFKPLRALVWAVGIWLLGVPIYQAAYEEGRMAPDNPLVLERYQVTCRTSIQNPNETEVNRRRPTDTERSDRQSSIYRTQNEDKLTNKNTYPGYEEFNAFVYSLDVFIPLMDFGQTSKWRPWSTVENSELCEKGHIWAQLPTDFKAVVEGAVRRGVLPWVYWFQVFFGWVLSTVVITGLTGLLQRGEND